jgi:hypothetical protein
MGAAIAVAVVPAVMAVSLTVFIERVITFRRSRAPPPVRRRVANHMSAGEVDVVLRGGETRMDTSRV